MACVVTSAIREQAAVIALERGCPDAARLLEDGHRFTRPASAMKGPERRAWAALVSARQPERDCGV